MARMTPVVRGEMLTGYVEEHAHQIRVGSPAWFAWLEKVSTFAFRDSQGTFTARKEPSTNGERAAARMLRTSWPWQRKPRPT